MVAAYALGVLMPAVAFARADHNAIIHVLSESHDGMLILHFHEDHGDHHHHPAKPGSGPSHHCCGVTSPAGLEPEAAASSIVPTAIVTALLPAAEPVLPSQGAARLDRPPKSL